MDLPPHRLSLPPGYTKPERGPSARQVWTRRLVALALVLGFLAVLYGVVRAASGGGGQSATTATVPDPLRIIFPEGFTRRDMADRIDAVNGIARAKRHVGTRLSPRRYLKQTRLSPLAGVYAGDRQQRSLEGFLFPDTYEFLPDTTTSQLIQAQLEAFRLNWKKVNLRDARSKNLTPYDVLIIASMVEKEVKAPEERRLVAAVIYNRLRLQIPLGIDATIRYGLNVPPTEALRKSQLASHNPYNTRNRIGLPPTPIANPGLASMQAAAHPANVSYLFFVRKPDNVHHFFTSSYAEFKRKSREFGFGGAG